ncbi:hypothetical protein [Sphingobium bisphenolivorans]|uniref:hypothetical protein n=1 Tax=Sphingobium bisphenolivorans TaxID=1335760 RepID=UPI0003A0C139|nr:hypothetical protein [Sphingobium bisphenolivorans]
MRASKPADTNADQVGSMREGVLTQKHLLIGEDGSPNNYDLNTGLAGAGGWRTPRHRHNFDQIRYVVEGDYPYMEDKVLPQGWVAYFPESVYYGPQDRPEGLRTMVLQFGGASGNGYLSVEGREAANDALKQKGEFKSGKFIYVDDSGEQREEDASAACFEYATGRKLEFAAPRYDGVIVMDPSAFAWLPGEDAGVEEKWLGSFTEREAKIGFIKIEAGATYVAGKLPSIAILFQTKGRITINGEEFTQGSAFEFLPGEELVSLDAETETELLCMTLHRF